jgi:hypothetical protein
MKKSLVNLVVLIFLAFVLINLVTIVSSLNENYVYSTSTSIILKPGERLVNLDKPKTDMICASGGAGNSSLVKNYERIVTSETGEEDVGGVATLSRYSSTAYIGKGVIQIVKDEKNNTVGEVETECICMVTDTFYNPNFNPGSPLFASMAEFSCKSVRDKCSLVDLNNLEQIYNTGGMGALINEVKRISES